MEKSTQMTFEGGTAVTATHTGSYRVKFARNEFLELVGIAQPEIIYHRKSMHFFAYDGFVMYSFECNDTDFRQKIIHAIEFSSYEWRR